MLSPESKSKWLTDINKRKYLLLKSNLIDLFTIAQLPIVYPVSGTPKTDRKIGDIVDYSEYHYTESFYIDLNKDNTVPTVSSDLIVVVYPETNTDSYILDKFYTNKEDLINYKLINIKKISSIMNFEFSNYLTSEQISRFSKYNDLSLLYFKQSNNKEQYKGYHLFTDTKFNFGLIDDKEENKPKYIVLSEYGSPAFPIYDDFILHSGDIENYITEDTNETITTTFGRYLANYYLLASVFDNSIPYQNKELAFGKLESIIAVKIRNKEITTQQGSKYLDHAFFLGSFGEMCVPTLTKKALTTSPEVQKKKKELLDKYKDQLNDPIIASQIEDELIKLDKEWLKGDPSMGFYGDSSEKFNTHRKKLFLTGGLVEDFTKDQGNYSFIEKSLSEGWDISSFAVICNEIRRGSYNRGIDTAKGGTKTKQLMRLVQNLKITNEDCGTKRYLNITLTEDNIHNFHGRYVLDEQTNKLVVITKENEDRYINKPIKIRSFMYCEQKDGFCNICGGEFLKNLEQDVVGVLALELTSTFTTLSLKSMHGSKASTLEINNLDNYTIELS